MNQIRRRVIGNSFWNILSEALAKGAVFIANIFLAQTLLADGYGMLVLAQSIVMYFTLAADLGISMYGIRQIAQLSDKSGVTAVVNPLVTFRALLGMATFLGYLAFISVFAARIHAEHALLIAAGTYLLTSSISVDWILRGLERFRLLAVSSLFSGGALLSALFLFVDDSADAWLAALAWSTSSLAALAIQLIGLSRLGVELRPRFALGVVLKHLRSSIYFTISGAFAAGYFYLPLILCAAALDAENLGLFAAPYRLISTLTAPGFFISAALYPILADLYVKDRSAYARLLRWFGFAMVLLGIVPAFICHYWSSEIVALLFGNDFTASAPIFGMLALLLPLTLLRYKYTLSLTASNGQHLQIPCFLLSALIVCVSFIAIAPSAYDLSVILVGAEVVLICSLALLGWRRQRRSGDSCSAPGMEFFPD